MIKVLKDRTIKQVTCPRCLSILEYDFIHDPFCDDIRYDKKKGVSVYSWYINCPKCNQKIKIDERI